jgi:tetratricopeptide (TPR) repeat protein
VFLLLILWVALPALTTTAEAQPVRPLEGSESERSREVPAQDLDDIHANLFRANQAYLEGLYEEAADGYEALLERGHLNGHVLFNLGNAYIRLGELGKAILHYKKASVLLPRDGDLKANLQYGRSLTKDRIEEVSPSFWHSLAFWYFGMNFRELLIAFVFLNTLLWGSALLHLYRESEWVKWSFWLSLLLSLILGVSAGLKYRESVRNTGGVILAEESPVRAGFSRSDTTLFVLHEGAEFTILDEEKGWWKIELQDGKKGWLNAHAGGRVAFHPPNEAADP